MNKRKMLKIVTYPIVLVGLIAVLFVLDFVATPETNGIIAFFMIHGT